MYVSYNSIDKSIKTKVPWLVNCLPMLSLVTAEAIEALMSKRLANKITVTFDFDYLPNVETEALVEYTDDNFRPREFTMTFNMAKFEEPWMMYLAAVHEAIHIKQYAKGELYQYSKRWRTLRWKKQQYRWHNKLTPEEEAAFPWEKEAYALEEKLFIKILKKINNGIKNLLADD